MDLPPGSGPFPAALIIAGSGPTDRDGNQPLLRNDSLKLLGQALAARGIAALRYDKRGIAESAAAAPREEDLRLETFVGDAVAWIALLRRDARFTRVAVIGHSEGSLIGMLAAKRARVDAFVSMAGPGRRVAELMREQIQTTLPPAQRKAAVQILDELVAGRTVPNAPKDLAALFRPSVQPYLISWLKYDPAIEIAGLAIPVLIVQGTTDLQVKVNDAKRLAAARKGAQLSLIEGMNHVLKHATTPGEQQAAYVDPSFPIDANVVGKIAAFLIAMMDGAR